MEILDPDLWNDDGTPKRPSKEYMQRLDQAQMAQSGAFGRLAADESFLNYARVKRETKAARPPEVGDVVHYLHVTEEANICRAAIVMEIKSFSHDACLRVHIPSEAFQDWQSEHDETKVTADSWHWPCGEGQ